MTDDDATRLQLRVVDAGDAEHLYRVYASTREVELAPLNWPPAEQEAFLRRQFQAQCAHWWRHYDPARFCVVSLDGVDVGRFYVERRTTEWRVVDIAFLPEYRSRGFASALLRGLFEEADATGLPVSIHVEQANPAQQLYLRLGFVFVDEAGSIYRLMERPAPTVRRTANA